MKPIALTPLLLTTCVAAGSVAVVRWFHPATFSPLMFPVLLLLALLLAGSAAHFYARD